MSRIVLLDTKLIPHVNFSNFQAEEKFLFLKFLGRLEEQLQPPDSSFLLKFGQNMS